MAWEQQTQQQKLNNQLDWTTDFSRNYLIYAESKTGKTYLATYKIKTMLEKDNKTTAYIINTDKGFSLPAKQVGLEKYKDRIQYYYVNDIKTAIKTIAHLKTVVKPNDIILFDLISWTWEEAQKFFIDELSGNDPANFIKKAMLDTKTFGMFEGTTWGFVKKLEDMISNYLTRNPICNVIAISGTKDVSIEYAMTKKKTDIWAEIDKPAGRKDLMFEFSNIIRIDKTNKGQRRFMIVGSRDTDVEFQWIDYTTAEDFWKKLEEKGIQ